MSRTIATIAAEAEADLVAARGRATTRTLDAAEIEDAIREHLRHARALAKSEPTTTVRTVLRGGYVLYGYRASADTVTITGARVDELAVDAQRAAAQSRPHGHGDRLIVRAVREGQRQGRIVVSR